MQTEVKIELKYCERCGGLFFRRGDETHVYCAPCAPAMRDVALPKKRPARAVRVPAGDELGGAA